MYFNMVRLKMIKPIALVGLLACFCLPLGRYAFANCRPFPSLAAIGQEGAIYGAEGVLVYKIRALSSQHQYASIYELLASDYTQTVTQRYFLGVCDRSEWEMSDVMCGTVEAYRTVAYMPIRCIVTRQDGSRSHINAVLFFRNTPDGWRLMNFPFLVPDLPSFSTIPSWFVNG